MPRNAKQTGSNFCVKSTSHMLGLGLGYKTIFFAIVPLPLLLTSYLAFMPPRDHQSQSGSQKTEETASSVTLCQSDAFATYPPISASALAPPPHSPTVSSATRSPQIITKTTAHFGRFATGALPLTTPTTIAPLLIINAPSPGASFPCGTYVQASSAPPLFKIIPMPCVVRSLTLT